MTQIYKLKKLCKEGYIPFEEESITIDTVDYSKIGAVVPENLREFNKSYQTIELPKRLHDILIELLSKYGFHNHNAYITFLCAVQNCYILYSEDVEDISLLKDFQNERKDLDLLLKSIHFYLNSEAQDNPEYINLKFIGEPALKIKNRFVIADIFKFICDGLDINVNTFESRSKDLIEQTNGLKFEKGRNYIKNITIRFLHKEITSGSHSNSEALRFIGLFLHLAQIKVNNENEDIEFYGNLTDNLKSIEIKNLQHSLDNRRDSFFL